MFKKHITYEQVSNIFRYDAETGELFWVIRPERSAVDIAKPAGCVAPDGYVVVKIRGAAYKAHRLIWLLMTKTLPQCDIDHIDRDRSNNKWSNLRLAPNNSRDNLQNTKLPSSNSSGVKGVSWNKTTSKWVASIKANAKVVFLGYHEDFFEAVCARKAAELTYHTFAYTQ